MKARAFIGITLGATALLSAALVSGCDESIAPGGTVEVSVSVTPPTISLPAGSSRDFRATVTNDQSAKGVTWSITGCSLTRGGHPWCGFLTNVTSTTVTYTAFGDMGATSLGVTAWSVEDKAKAFTASVAVVNPGPASRLFFQVQPANVFATRPLVVQVTALDQYGNVATNFHGPVTVALAFAPSGASLSGTTTVNAVSGVAAFTDLSVDSVGSGYALTGSAVGLPSVTSATFKVVALGSVPTVAGTWDLLFSDGAVGTLVLQQSPDSVTGGMTIGDGTSILLSGTVSASGSMVLRYWISRRVVFVLAVQCDAAPRSFSGTLTHIIYSRPGGAYTIGVTGTKR